MYNTVPKIISGKDLDYLSDIFNWNISAYKKVSNAISEVQDSEIKNMLEKASDVFYENANKVLNILNGGANQ